MGPKPLKKTMKKREGDDSAGAGNSGDATPTPAGGDSTGDATDKKETPGPVEETCVVNDDGSRTPAGCKTKEEKAAAVEVPCVINEDGTRNPEGCKTVDEKAA